MVDFVRGGLELVYRRREFLRGPGASIGKRLNLFLPPHPDLPQRLLAVTQIIQYMHVQDL